MENSLTSSHQLASSVGEEIGLHLGRTFILDYQSKNQSNCFSYYVGRNIIEKILAQPDCHGLVLFDALNEIGEKTLVYMGQDIDGKPIWNYSTIEPSGEIKIVPAIVADRIKMKPWPTQGTLADSDDWGWTID